MQKKSNLVFVSNEIEAKTVQNSMPNVKLNKFSPLSFLNISFNFRKETIKNLKVRQGINHIIDRRKASERAYGTFAIPAVNPIPPVMWSFHKGLKIPNYNVKKGRKLLREGNLPKDYVFRFVYNKNHESAKKVVGSVVEDFKKAGLQIKAIPIDRKEWFHNLLKYDFDMTVNNWIGDNGDPDNFFYTLLSTANIGNSTFNIGGYSRMELDSWLFEAKAVPYPQHRTKLYKKIQEFIYNDPPWVPISHFLNAFFVSDSLKGVTVSPLYELKLKNAYFEK